MTTQNTTIQDETNFEEERLARWRLILSKAAETSGTPQGGASWGKSGGEPRGNMGRKAQGLPGLKPNSKAAKVDEILEKLYDHEEGEGESKEEKGRGTLADSAPSVSRWLGDVRKYFPQSVVQIVQNDALKRFGVESFLHDSSVLETLEPDVHLVSMLISLSSAISDDTKDSARMLVRKLVDDVMKRIDKKMIDAIKGALSRTIRTNHPRYGELDFGRTIKLNLKNWDEERQSLVVDKLVGYGRRRNSLYDVVICVDQSGSMTSSLVYASIFAAVLASIHSISTRLVFFDTSVVDMTEKYDDPVDILFGAQLGGGTDIGSALKYCKSVITRPEKTVLILISDFYEGGDERILYETAESIIMSGVKLIGLLALDDDGAPSYDHETAANFASLGAPTFACTPDLFPELIAAAINGSVIKSWATSKGLVPVGAAIAAGPARNSKRA